ncbi:MAG: hypothetical protein QOF62_1620 [Pyrinomonadaceae bacterium]|jgi:uncharacterized protein (DUF1697 family)|nr:hypothetical protein [Pyrinomonadaceae bacterium]
MPKFIAFLRAINVGGHVVKMDQLRQFFEALGFANIETFIASGNVIFEAKSKDTNALQLRIEKHLHKALGYEVVTLVRTLEELDQIANHRPFAESEMNRPGNTLYVGFIADNPAKAVSQKVEALATEVDDLKVAGREVYWLLRTNFSDSKLSGAIVERTLGMKATFRNINTVRRILKKYS